MLHVCVCFFVQFPKPVFAHSGSNYVTLLAFCRPQNWFVQRGLSRLSHKIASAQLALDIAAKLVSANKLVND